MTEVVTYEIAKAAKEKGLENVFTGNYSYLMYEGTEDESKYISNCESIIDKEKATHITQETEVTYHQLIDWVFRLSNPNLPLKTDKSFFLRQVEWLEFWYNLLKDCPLKYEFKGRLLEWFDVNGYYFRIDYLRRFDRYSSHGQKGLIGRGAHMPTKESAEHLAVLDIFRALKNG